MDLIMIVSYIAFLLLTGYGIAVKGREYIYGKRNRNNRRGRRG